MPTKKCSCCGAEKPFDAFQKRAASCDGLTASCKACLSERDKRRANNPNRVLARAAYSKTDAFRVSHNAASRKYAKQNRERRSAQVAVNNAIRDGKIFSQPCHVCGKEKSEAHHADYSRPLDVVWLCPTHHAQLHKEHRDEFGED